MITLLSPAKKLLKTSKPSERKMTQPALIEQTIELVRIMKSKSLEEIAHLMDLSSDLAELNYQRYLQFDLKNDPSVSFLYPALFLFQGDVYQGLEANTWSAEDVEFAQEHLGILSGLYGFLRPLDGIQAYRLEMGVHLKNPKGATLYEFWRETIVNLLKLQLKAQKNPVVINLASTEYFKVVDEKKLSCPVITINFYEHKNNQVKMIGIYAKKARGMMAKYIVQNRIDHVDKLKEFNISGYSFNSKTSSENHLDFIRTH